MYRRLFAIFTTVVLTIGLLAPATAQTLRLVTGFPTSFVFNREVTELLVTEVRKLMDGKVTITVVGPEAVPTFEQFDPVAKGLLDILVTHPGYHSGVTSLGLALDAIEPKPEARRASGVWEYFDAHYARHGMKLVAIPALGSKGFQLFTRRPLAEKDGKPFDGMKIRAVETYFPMIKQFGGVPVVMPGNDIYTALDRGVVDGAIWGIIGLKELKWNEVADRLVRPLFGQASLMIFIGRPTWDRLDERTRNALLEAGRRVENVMPSRFDELQAAEEQALLKLGMRVERLPGPIAGTLEDTFANSVWSLVETKAGADATKLRAIARSAGLTP